MPHELAWNTTVVSNLLNDNAIHTREQLFTHLNPTISRSALYRAFKADWSGNLDRGTGLVVACAMARHFAVTLDDILCDPRELIIVPSMHACLECPIRASLAPGRCHHRPFYS